MDWTEPDTGKELMPTQQHTIENAPVKPCKRCKWTVVDEFESPFPLPNGGVSNRLRTYQMRECVVCGCRGGRWKPRGKP